MCPGDITYPGDTMHLGDTMCPGDITAFRSHGMPRRNQGSTRQQVSRRHHYIQEAS